MPTPLTEPQLLDALAQGTRVVLPNSRAARALRRAFDERQRATGASAWESAAALSWADWTRSLWSALVADGAELRLLLNSAQEHTLWREVIAAAAEKNPSLHSPDALAELARSAWQLAATHRAVPRLRSTASTSDSRTFSAWAESFARLCAAQNCLSSAQLEDALREHVLNDTLNHALRLDSPTLLAGFDDLTPAQIALLEALRSTGASLETISLTSNEKIQALQEQAQHESATADESLAAQQESVISTGAQRSGETPVSRPNLHHPVISTEAQRSGETPVFRPNLHQSVISTGAQRSGETPVSRPNLHHPVISTGAQRSGETPVFRPNLHQSVISTGAQRSGETCISTLPTQAANPSILRAITLAPNPREELQLAAHWLRRFLEDHTTPTFIPRVAVLLPQPEEDRAEIESIFRAILAPELQPIAADLSSTPWEFAAGALLASQPLVADALDLLRWTTGPLPIERVSALLRSPFLGGAATHPAAARFDAHTLRRTPLLLPELDIETVRQLDLKAARRQNTQDAPTALPWLQTLSDTLNLRRNPSARTFADWAEHCRALLHAASWPGDRNATASEFAASTAWDGALDLLSTLDFRGRRVPLADALQSLERLIQTARVPPPASGAPIQIMRPGEAEGSVFDAVVLLRATDENYPEPQHLHPLLGWPLQQSLNLPGANAAHDTDRARHHAESILARTATILVTSAKENADGQLRPSPLLHQLGIKYTEIINIQAVYKPLHEDIISDDTPLPPLPTASIHGGATVLKQQAACGFLAFAELRLNAKSPEPVELGLDPGERGNLVHTALENFWATTHSQQELRSLSASERALRLDAAIDAAFARLRIAPEIWSTAYLNLQRDRLRALLDRWLDVELQRGPFTVLSREAKAEIDIGPLRLSLRPDRIDRIDRPGGDNRENGGFALVDYKTGYNASPAHWLGDRPDDPQLPLYALLLEPGELKALLFGRLRPGDEMEWTGFEAEPAILPRRNPVDMDAQIDEWRDVLTALAHDFASGRAAVDPKNYAVNCKRCGQRLLCRLDPSTLHNADDETNEDQEDTNG